MMACHHAHSCLSLKVSGNSFVWHSSMLMLLRFMLIIVLARRKCEAVAVNRTRQHSILYAHQEKLVP